MTNVDKINALENEGMLDRMSADFTQFKQTYRIYTKLGVAWTKWLAGN